MILPNRESIVDALGNLAEMHNLQWSNKWPSNNKLHEPDELEKGGLVVNAYFEGYLCLHT